MSFYVFADQPTAQSAADAIWSAIAPITQDVNAATGEAAHPDVTNAWAIPWQRVTDSKWVVPVCGAVPNTSGWATETYDPSWNPPPATP